MTPHPTIPLDQFNRLIVGKVLSAPIIVALRLHMVEGLAVTVACKRSGVSRPGFYRARKALDVGPTPPESLELTFAVPAHRMDTLNQMVSYQLSLWAQEDARLANELGAQFRPAG